MPSSNFAPTGLCSDHLLRMSDQVAPRVPELRKSMNTDNQRTIASDSHVQFNGPVLKLNKIQGVPLDSRSRIGQ